MHRPREPMLAYVKRARFRAPFVNRRTVRRYALSSAPRRVGKEEGEMKEGGVRSREEPEREMLRRDGEELGVKLFSSNLSALVEIIANECK